MRSSRLLAIVMELTRVESITVSALARRHGVSSRTIQRDIAEMFDMGVPVWTRTGPAGGVGLAPGWTSPLLGMTTPEIRALLIGEAGAQDLGLGAEYRSAHLKIDADTSDPSQSTRSLGQKILIDNSDWFASPDEPASLPSIARAVWSGHRIQVRYRGYRRTVPANRLLDPLGLVLKTDRWYLVSAHRGKPRTYRVSRIEDIRVLSEVAHVPKGFSLSEYWSQARSGFDAAIRTITVQLSVPESSLDDLRRSVPGSATETAIDSAVQTDGHLRIDLPVENVDVAAAQLIPIPGVEVHEPAELRAKILAHAHQLARHHRPRTSESCLLE